MPMSDFHRREVPCALDKKISNHTLARISLSNTHRFGSMNCPVISVCKCLRIFEIRQGSKTFPIDFVNNDVSRTDVAMNIAGAEHTG